ncbi:MAG TPA: helix-turn-helix domain-containing protein [Bryobacteraceae bacterium]|nr:helix-turn-helix domain-containing protein [Bryobacteraceae bacterium]
MPQLQAAETGAAVPVRLGAKLLIVALKAADLMLGQLGGARPRELTDRCRFSAWGIV